jgi:hypothetical protein
VVLFFRKSQRAGPDGVTRVITRRSSAERESVLVEAGEAELLVFRRWEEFHRKALGFMPSWGCMCAEARVLTRQVGVTTSPDA